MTRPHSEDAGRTREVRPDAGLQEACALVEAASRVGLTLVPDDPDAGGGAVQVGEGWALRGDVETEVLRSLAALVDRLARSEAEIEGLCGEIRERYEEVTLVYRLSSQLGSVLGEDEIARLVVREASRVLGARAAEIWLRNDSGDLRRAGVIPEDTGEESGCREAFAALDEGKPWVREASSGGEAVVAVPLPSAQGTPLGLLALIGRSAGRSYRSSEVKLLMAIATLASAFIRNGRLASQARRAEARKREDEIARQIHRGLLPHREPAFHGLDIAGVCSSAETVGGDYYGYIPMPDGSLGLAMADISGHGVGAALYMAAAKGALQAEARRILSPADLLRRTNEALVADFSESDVFATAFVARFHPGGRTFDFSNGGHNPPLLVRAGGKVERLMPGGPALGLLRRMDYQEESRSLEPGDALLVYTDGLIEARDTTGTLYGMKRLEAILPKLRDGSAAEILRQVREDLAEHGNGIPPQDDVTLVVVKAVEPPAGRGGGEFEA